MVVVVATDIRHSSAGFSRLVNAASSVHQLFRQRKWNSFRRRKVSGTVGFKALHLANCTDKTAFCARESRRRFVNKSQ